MSPEPAFAFGPFELRPAQRRLLRAGEPVALSVRQADLLLTLVTRAGQVVTKDELIAAAWPDVAVTENSVEQAVSSLRRVLDHDAPARYIETQPRRGYRFAAPVNRITRRDSDATLAALLAPHRAWIEGRAALETLERVRIRHAREVFERVLTVAPDQALAHVGLANAYVLQFETTRVDPDRDLVALALAERHAREACRLDPGNGEMWATLGFVIERTGHYDDALAALHRAVTLEPDNWRHQLRLSYGSWGEERLRAARRALALLPGCGLAHWLAATVHVARQALDAAGRELATAAASTEAMATTGGRYRVVALPWLAGLLALARGDEGAALAAFHRELAMEHHGQLYARECCANAHYAIAALHLRAGRREPALGALHEALSRVPSHPLARVALGHLDPGWVEAASAVQAAAGARGHAVDVAMAAAATLALQDRHSEAAAVVERALEAGTPGSAGWLLPVEPLLQPLDHPDAWAGALARLRGRAA